MRTPLLALAAIATLGGACGNNISKAGVLVPGAGNDAGAGAPNGPSPGLPPMAAMPPPGVTGSRKAVLKRDGALYACGGGSPAGTNPVARVKAVGEACAMASKMHAVGALIRGTGSDRDAHQEFKSRVEANKCYRVYVSTDDMVKDAVVVMRDSAGDLVGETAGAALPDDGAFCFTSADEITLLIAIGSGKGAFAAQLWGD